MFFVLMPACQEKPKKKTSTREQCTYEEEKRGDYFKKKTKKTGTQTVNRKERKAATAKKRKKRKQRKKRKRRKKERKTKEAFL